MDADENDGEKSAHLRRATEAFMLDLFWGHMEVLWLFASLLDHINNWCTACPCHPTELCAELEMLADKENCHMRGRRVAEICCGGLEHICEDAADLLFTQLKIATQSYEERISIRCFLSSSE